MSSLKPSAWISRARIFRWRPNCATLLTIIAMLLCLQLPANAEEVLREGDRVVLLGATFVERMQATGYLESQLTTAFTGKPLVLRNLGWSGDNVRGHSRAVFGNPDEGFNRLIKDFKQTKPTVAVVCYGANEANAGTAKLPQFKQDYNRLLDALNAAAPGLRLVLVAPPQRENVGEPFPQQDAYNKTLQQFSKAIHDIADARNSTFIDMTAPVKQSHALSSSAALDQLTDNGVHFTKYGYWRAAPVFAAKLGAKTQAWDVNINASTGHAEAKGATVTKVEPGETLKFSAVDATLSQQLPPPHSPRGAEMMMQQARLRVTNLPAGKYQLSVAGKPIVAATAKHWAEGVHFARKYAQPQLDKLTAAIEEKNAMFFHRHRPQNETYLFLFRKHEQGNNAVEIPQFDPLIEKLEDKIAKLAKPVTHPFELKRIQD